MLSQFLDTTLVVRKEFASIVAETLVKHSTTEAR